MAQHKVTMSQIAQAAGVSQPTVSIVLSGSNSINISEETRKKVIEVAESFGYKKKLSKPLNKKKHILFILDGSIYPNEHFTLSFNAASQKAQDLNVVLSYINTLYTTQGREDIYKELDSGLYDACIVASSMTNYNMPIVDLKLPTVYLNCCPNSISDFVSVLPDDYGASYKLISHVYKKYTNPAFLIGDIWMQATSERLQAARDLYQSINVNIDENMLFHTSWSFKRSFSATLDLLSRPKHPDILICASDHIALGAYQAIYYLGLKIPQDIAVIGFDNQYICTELTPQLTTVEHPYNAMAEIAVDYAYQLAKQNNVKSIKTCKVCGDVFLRESCIVD